MPKNKLNTSDPSAEIIKSSVVMPEGVTLSTLQSNYQIAANEYSLTMKKAVKLDATDDGSLWAAVKAKFPEYQILPDSNWVSYVKNNILASVYTVGKSASIIPTSDEDKDIVTNINIIMEKIWEQLGVAGYQMAAGERAALLNYGITQVGWDNSITSGTGKAFKKGDITLKNINPLRFMRDPFAESLELASYCMVWDDYHKTVIANNPNYKTEFESYLTGRAMANPVAEMTPTAYTDKAETTKKDYYRVFVHWVAIDGKVHEIHTINNERVLYVREDIKPSCFPFAELYCNLPAGNLIGTSECARIFNNNLAYNLMLSIMLTSEHKNQRPPRFVNGQSGLNVTAFTKSGNDADHTFIVQGDASKAVHYHQFPQVSPYAPQVMSLLSGDIQNVTGVDGRYTGRDTGSILTTGGVDSMLNQVTLIDAMKVENYEKYCKQLTKLIMSNYTQHSSVSRSYFVQDKSDPKKWDTVKIDFPNIDAETLFDYSISISSDLPKNKARIESVANHLMEMQMQYQGAGIDVDLITPQEWLMMQDIPNKEFMLERMDVQRTQNWQNLVAQAVQGFSAGIESGLNSDEALEQTAQMLAMQAKPSMGNAQQQGVAGAQPMQEQVGSMLSGAQV